jgi:spermidine synthase
MARALALFLTVMTGFSGLSYEVAWQKYLATLLGSHSEATAAVLAIFLGGLAVGYSVFGATTARFTERARARGEAPRLLFLYGAVEAGIGVSVMLFPLLFGLAQAVSYRFPADPQIAAFAFDVFLTVLLIGPPTVLMGGTIPILTQALAHDLDDATRVHAWIYAFNTLGAFAGALAAGFVLVPLLGLDGVLYSMGCINLAAGVVFLLLQRRASRHPASPAPVGAAVATSGAFAPYAAVALLSGFAMMAIQTVLNRVGGMAFGASHFTFAMVVAVFVLCIALGSFVVSALPRIPPLAIVGSQWALVGLLALLYTGLDEAPYFAHALRSLIRDEAPGFWLYHGVAFLGILALLAVPVGLSGALLPLLFHHLRREMGDLGAVAGRLYSWNTLGSLLGALLGGYALLLWLDLHHVYAIALGALALGAGLLTWRVLRPPPWLPLAATAAALAALALLPPWRPDRLASGTFRLRQPTPVTFAGPGVFFAWVRGQYATIFHDDDPTSTATVRESYLATGQASRSIINNGKSDGNMQGDYPTMALAGLLPAFLADDPARSFVIGYGTGVTAGELAALSDTREVVVAEISRGVLRAAPLFDYGNLNASHSPKLRVARSDAYRALLRSAGRFGVIASEPSNPWGVGVEMLFSREFLEAARARLTPGGVYAQWMHTYEIDQETVEIVLRTYALVFDHVAVWFTMGPDVLLLGFASGEHALDVARMSERFARPDFAAGFGRAGIHSVETLFAHELLPLGTVHAARLEGPVHTLRHPILSHYAARAFFRGQGASVPRLATQAAAEIGLRNSLWRRSLGARADAPSEDDLAGMAEETCRLGRFAECAVAHARWLRDRPHSARRKSTLDAWRASSQAASSALNETALHNLATLVRPGEAFTSLDADPAVAATQVTALFSDYYLHALPFDRRVVAAEWQRCDVNRRPIEPCLDGRSLAERALGSLSAARGRSGG